PARRGCLRCSPPPSAHVAHCHPHPPIAHHRPRPRRIARPRVGLRLPGRARRGRRPAHGREPALCGHVLRGAAQRLGARCAARPETSAPARARDLRRRCDGLAAAQAAAGRPAAPAASRRASVAAAAAAAAEHAAAQPVRGRYHHDTRRVRAPGAGGEAGQAEPLGLKGGQGEQFSPAEPPHAQEGERPPPCSCSACAFCVADTRGEVLAEVGEEGSGSSRCRVIEGDARARGGREPFARREPSADVANLR
ncbi:hypothetical protein EMIHUDRAFT_445443, partial [Emiliania huxleyi CCMP1516]